MMYTPKFLSPKNKSIDASVDNVFTWKTQGEPQTDFQLKIYKNSDDTLVYDSTKLTSALSTLTVPASTLSNILQYKWNVKTFGTTGDATSDYAFLATNNTPVVTLTVPPTLTTQTHKFVANYTQSENISIKKYRFILYDNTNGVIQDTDWIYGFTPEYLVDGLLNGKTYKIECLVVSQNEMEATSGKQTFSVAYALPDFPRSIKITSDNIEGKNIISWDRLKQVTPIVTGVSSYVDGKFEKGLKLEDGADITYSEKINEDFTLTWHTAPIVGFEGVILELDDSFVLGYENNKFYIINQNIKFTSDPVNLYTWEDVGEATWAELLVGSTTWNDIYLAGNHIKDFLFIALTFNTLIVKRKGSIIASIEMGV